MTPREFRAKIRRLLRHHTRDEIAQRLGCTPQAVGIWLRDAKVTPRLKFRRAAEKLS